MKFYCLKCNSKYSIKDEDIPEKGATTICKNCGNKIAIAKPQNDQKSEEDHDTTSKINQINDSEPEKISRNNLEVLSLKIEKNIF